MAMTTDPVCGMRIDTEDAAAFAEFEGATVYFCSQACLDLFVANPGAAGPRTVSGSPDRLTEEEFAARVGTSRDDVRQLVGLGIVSPDDDTFARVDVMRARVIGDLRRSGVEIEGLATALASGHLTLGYLESAGRRHPRSDQTFAEVGDAVGLPFATLERLYVAFGLPRPEPDERVRAEDLETIGLFPVLLGIGLTEAEVLRLARVWGDSARRVAQYLPHFFHSTVEARYRGRGLRDNEAFDTAVREVGLRAGRSGEDLLGWLFRRHSEVFMTEHQLGHVEAALEEAGVRQRQARATEAIAFADLSGYTQLTEESGDEAAADAALTLAQVASEVAGEHGGSTVKLLGDGVLLHFRDPHDAVRGCLDIVDRAPAEGLPPAHVGVDAGPMLYDEGDYFGRTVNRAARLASAAGAGQVYVGESLSEPGPHAGFALRAVGELQLKGIAGPVLVFEAIRA